MAGSDGKLGAVDTGWSAAQPVIRMAGQGSIGRKMGDARRSLEVGRKATM